MSSSGVVRPVDKMGRVVIPKEIRDRLNIESDVDSIEFFLQGDEIVLRKYRPACVFCDKLGDSINYGGYTVCLNCIDKLEKLKQDI